MASRKAQKVLDRWHSRMVRVKDAIRTTGGPEMLKCITCPTILPVKEAQACHFIKRTYISRRWDDHNVHGGCPYCNASHNDDISYYESVLVGMYGIDEVERLKTGFKASRKMYDYELLAQAQECMEYVLENAPGLYPKEKII